MNRDDIIRMAREAGFSATWPETVPNFERFAALVAAAEREACAKQAENMDAAVLAMLNNTRHPIAIAAKIRARGQE